MSIRVNGMGWDQQLWQYSTEKKAPFQSFKAWLVIVPLVLKSTLA